MSENFNIKSTNPYKDVEITEMSNKLKDNIMIAKKIIKEFYTKLDGKVFVGFSGGKDSLVLLHLVRQMYPNVQGVFSDTGLEFHEIKKIVRSKDNIAWLRPKIPFTDMIEQHGVPYPSKTVVKKIYDIRNTKSDKYRKLLLDGDPSRKSGGLIKLPSKWTHLLDEDMKYNNKCCSVLKKNPMRDYSKETGNYPFIGTLAEESNVRELNFKKHGFNIYDGTNTKSRPLSLFTMDQIWEYITYYNLEYATIYDKGHARTGCMFCLFGIQFEGNEMNRLQLLSITHPKQYKYIMGLKDYKKILNLEGISYLVKKYEENRMEKQIWVIRKNDGEMWGGRDWVKDLKFAKVYSSPGSARSIVTKKKMKDEAAVIRGSLSIVLD